MTDPRDTIVGDALRRLDVPAHAPDFWDRVDAELARPNTDEDRQSDRDEDDHEADVVELTAARATRSARSTRLPAAAAAAAAVAAIALAVGLPAAQQAADGDEQVEIADAPDSSSVPEPSAPVTTDPPTTATAPAAQVAPEEVATEWLTLLRDGETEQAHALLDLTSQEALPLEEFREVATGLAEGAGAFAGLEPSVVPLVDDEGLAATAVVFTGDVEREGMVETASYPVVVTGAPDDGGRPYGIAFVLDGPTVEAVQRTQPSETRTSPVELELSPTAGATWAIVDGTSPQRIDTGESTVSVDVEVLAGPGTHTLAVISTEGGRYTARSFTVVVP